MQSSALFYERSAENQAETHRVVACVDSSGHAPTIISHAYAIGAALAVPVTLLKVLEAQPEHSTRPDPIEWDLRRREARAMLRKLADDPGSPSQVAAIQLAEGLIADEILRFTHGNRDNLLVLGTQGERGLGRQCIGGTVHDVLEHALDSVLLVPAVAAAENPHYGRIAVPLDGSPWAESVMPLAVRVARATGGELILVHVVPSPELTEPRPLEPEDLELRRRVIERNELAARDYLDRLRRQLAAQDIPSRVILKRGDNVRAVLARTVSAEGADLVIMSARGHGTCEHADVHYGNVTSYLMNHAAVPVLIARSRSPMPAPEVSLISAHRSGRSPAAGPT